LKKNLIKCQKYKLKEICFSIKYLNGRLINCLLCFLPYI